MSSMAMPLAVPGQEQMMPGSVPTSSTAQATPAPVAANPGIAPLGTVQNNPFAAPTASSAGARATTLNPTAGGVAPTSQVPTGNTVPLPPGTVQQNGINWNDGSNTVVGDFKDTYGAGTGTAITDVLKNLGTSTDQAVQATIANTNYAANQQYGNIQASEAASGITPNSSTAGLAAGDFYAGVNSQLQSTIANEELDEENTLLSTLTGEGQAHGTDPSTFDAVLNGISDAGEIAGAVAPFLL